MFSGGTILTLFLDTKSKEACHVMIVPEKDTLECTVRNYQNGKSHNFH